MTIQSTQSVKIMISAAMAALNFNVLKIKKCRECYHVCISNDLTEHFSNVVNQQNGKYTSGEVSDELLKSVHCALNKPMINFAQIAITFNDDGYNNFLQCSDSKFVISMRYLKNYDHNLQSLMIETFNMNYFLS